MDFRGARQPVIRYNSMKSYTASELIEMPGDFMPFEYAQNPRATGHGGIDYALLDHFFQAVLRGDRTGPVSLREGLRMTLPGLYAEESARRGGEVMKMLYPWSEGWKTCSTRTSAIPG